MIFSSEKYDAARDDYRGKLILVNKESETG